MKLLSGKARLSLLKKFEKEGNRFVYRRKSIIDDVTKESYVVDDKDDYVEYCPDSGLPVGYGTNETDFTFKDTVDDRICIRWADELLKTTNPVK